MQCFLILNEMKYFFTLIFSILCSYLVNSQAFPGDPILKVFANYHREISKEKKNTAFEIKRVYLGYRQKINENFSAEVKLDIGSPEDQSRFSLIRRYAYFKTAALYYKKNNLIIYLGLFDM